MRQNFANIHYSTLFENRNKPPKFCTPSKNRLKLQKVKPKRIFVIFSSLFAIILIFLQFAPRGAIFAQNAPRGAIPGPKQKQTVDIAVRFVYFIGYGSTKIQNLKSAQTHPECRKLQGHPGRSLRMPALSRSNKPAHRLRQLRILQRRQTYRNPQGRARKENRRKKG